ncbi:MAG: response regulator [Deltaproteobacteria bacterium]|nr:response regulator [Deltaproteobacteria bacterium]
MPNHSLPPDGPAVLDAWSHSPDVVVRVLLVEDNRELADLQVMLLEQRGHEVRAALDGGAALALVEDYVPDIVLLDLGLPDMDGFEVLAKLRALEHLDGVRFVALSGSPAEELGRSWRDAGFDLYVLKPIDIDELESIILP